MANVNLVNLKTLVVGSDNGFIKIFDITSKKANQLKNIGNGIAITALCPVGNQGNCAIALNDFNIVLYNTTLAKTISKFNAHENTVSCIKYCSDQNKIITTGYDCTYKIWDPNFKLHTNAFYDCEDKIISCDYNSNTSTFACLDESGHLV